MVDTAQPGRAPSGRAPAADGSLSAALLGLGRYFRHRATTSDDLRVIERTGGREGDVFYRDRWSHDKVVRSTHGVNCTGSCSWKVYVKDGIITWESQQTDYPSVGPDSPEYEPRGCPRGAAFSWYTYSPTRVRYPYARGVLVELYREARARLGDPVAAWASVVGDPETRRRYQRARGKGGHVRVSWDEAVEIVAAAHVHTIATYGPDRVAGFSPIPAMSMVSHAVGARFVELLGGVMTSFYDWYADLPVASPQVFGDQTDVPESGDWWNSSYLLMWGSNVPVTRTPDAHWMAEARYKGTKVVTVSPDYADNTKFADEWLPAQPGTDGALAMAMGHVILREFLVEQRTPFFVDYLATFTDMPFLVTLDRRDDLAGGGYEPGKFLTAADLGGDHAQAEGAEWKTVLVDGRTGDLVVPNGSLGFRYTDSGVGRWNLDLGGVAPQLTMYGRDGRTVADADAAGGDAPAVEVLLPRFDTADGHGEVLRRGVPVLEVGGRLVTTVFDLVLAQYGVRRPGLPGRWPTGYDDTSQPYTPAWQEPLTSVPAARAAQVAREMARNAEVSGGRTMVILGAGVCQWFHGDATYRAILSLLLFTGSMGRNGGGWAHYVGQEKCRPLTGHATMAMALDWVRPPRQMIGTAFWYTHTDQWRYDGYRADALTSPLARGHLAGMHTADTIAQSARLGWMPSYPQFDRSPLQLADDAAAAGATTPAEVGAYVVRELDAGRLRWAAEDPDAPENWPRILTLWRANLLGSSSQGQRVLPQASARHPLRRSAPRRRRRTGGPRDVTWRDEAPEGKLDLLVSLDFRMTSARRCCRTSCCPRRRGTRSTTCRRTDMHPFVHAFTPAIDPPWETRSDFDAFHAVARRFSELAGPRLGVRRDLVATPLQHDTPGETAQPGGRVRDWRRGEVDPVPGRTMPSFTVVERDYGAVADAARLARPARRDAGPDDEGAHRRPGRRGGGARPRERRHARRSPATAGRRSTRDAKMAETILALSGTTNGRLAVQGFRRLEERTGRAGSSTSPRAARRGGSRSPTPRPARCRSSRAPSGPAARPAVGGTPRSPINVERLKPWHTLTGRMHFFLDHDWMHEFGESMPTYRPPLDMQALFGERALGTVDVADGPGATGQKQVTVRYLTPHSKWSIHSEYQDNLLMLSLSRGGPTLWMSVAGRRSDRREGQRLGRGGQPQRRPRRPRHRHPPAPGRARSSSTTPRNGS